MTRRPPAAATPPRPSAALRAALVCLLALLLLGCITIAAPTPAADLMSTVVILQTNLASVQTAAAQPTLTPHPSLTPIRSPSPSPSVSPSPSPSPSPTRPGVKADRAEFVSETIPDKTVFAPGTVFRKSWRLINRGSTTWTTEYALVFVDGHAMGAAETIYLTQNVPPNQTITLSVNFKAPAVKGEYKSFWKLRNADGVTFGLGEQDQPFFADIIVGDPAAKSNGVVHSVVIERLSEINNPYDCFSGAAVTFRGGIIVNQPGEIEYIWRHNGINLNPPEKRTFTRKNESADIYHEWVIKQSGLYDVELVILSPETVVSNKLGFEITCLQ